MDVSFFFNMARTYEKKKRKLKLHIYALKTYT